MYRSRSCSPFPRIPWRWPSAKSFSWSTPDLRRIPAEDTAGSVRIVLQGNDRTAAGIAGKRAAEYYGGAILAENIQDNAENFTRFVLLRPAAEPSPDARKMSLAMRLIA